MSFNFNDIHKLWNKTLKKADQNKPKFTILLPPPNITGSLHIGHFLNWSLQDCLMRNAYIDGMYPNWITGLDHAGISMQFIVERELEKLGINRHELSYEEFYAHTLKWKETSEALITEQALQFGFFFDWENRRFTMDDEYQQSVLEAFCKLYEDGLIKKNARITSWDPKFQTALSDLEIVEKNEIKKIYTIRYNSVDGKSSVEIATTRPETIFADCAICAHPDDERYQHLKGQKFLIPLINKEIPIIFDDMVEMEKGTGVLKVTPAQDQKDFEIGLKHNLDYIQIINKEGVLFNVPDEYKGKTIKEARTMILNDLEKSEQFIEENEIEGLVYYGEKSGAQVETIITQQWFLDVSSMAQMAINRSHEIDFIPDNLKEVFHHWMHNIRPWCISRQITWGHRLPIWYKSDGSYVCAPTREKAEELAQTTELTQESDVLDTWFSSALWPMATQETFAITDVLITGKDILFFWVARMIMFNLYFKNEVPFKQVYFNGIVRDAQRQKMSKTKGNVLNPLDLRDEYGNDAIRLAMLRKTSFNKDISLQTKDFEEGRAFCTKINNAAKFVKEFMSKDWKENSDLDNWMATQIHIFEKQIKQSLANFSFHEACTQFYDLFWNNFCAWYIECLKVYPSEKAAEYLIKILKIGHPLIPWASEEAFQYLQDQKHEISIMDYQTIEYHLNENNIKNFEKTIKITKLLRKLKMISSLASFNIENTDAKLIEFLSKLPLDSANDFPIKFDDVVLYITKEAATEAKVSIEKELSELTENIKFSTNRINSAQKVPDEIMIDWKNQLNILNENLDVISQWLANLS